MIVWSFVAVLKQSTITEITISARTLAFVISITATAVLVSARLTPYCLAVWLIVALSVSISEGRFKALKFTPDGVTIYIAMFLAYAMLSSFWSLQPVSTMGQVALAGLIFLGARVLIGLIAFETAERSALMAYWLVAGFALGLGYLAYEVLSDQAIKRWLFNTFTFIEPTNQKYYQRAEGRISTIASHDLNRSVAALNFLLWPVLLCVSWLWRGAWRWAITFVLLATAVAATFGSVHETSMIAILVGTAVFALSCFRPSLSLLFVKGAWLFAVFAVIPVALLAFHLGVHKMSWLPHSGQDRIVIWKHTATQTLKAPILGVGARTTYFLGPKLRKTAKPLPYVRQVLHIATHSHNVYMQTWFELGAVGALLLSILGLGTLARIEKLEEEIQPYALATFLVVMVTIASTYGFWQSWFLALFALAAVAMSIATVFARHALLAARESGAGRFTTEIAMWSKSGALGLFAVATSVYIFVMIAMTEGDGVTPSSKTAQMLLNELSVCRVNKTADCSIIAGQLASRMLDGDTKIFNLSKKSKFGVYLHKDQLVYVRVNCKLEETRIDVFTLNFWPQDVNVLPRDRRQFGFASLDFHFSKNGYRAGKYCLALVKLPTDRIKKILTGQYQAPTGFIWHVTIVPRAYSIKN